MSDNMKKISYSSYFFLLESAQILCSYIIFCEFIPESRSFTEQGSIERLSCPINGQFHFTYNIDDGTEDVRECPQSTSALANCPRSSELQIRCGDSFSLTLYGPNSFFRRFSGHNLR